MLPWISFLRTLASHQHTARMSSTHTAKGPWRHCQGSWCNWDLTANKSHSPKVKITFQKLRSKACGKSAILDCVPHSSPVLTHPVLTHPGQWPQLATRSHMDCGQTPRCRLQLTAQPFRSVAAVLCSLPPEVQMPAWFLSGSVPVQTWNKSSLWQARSGSKVCFYVCWQIQLSPATITTLFFISSRLFQGWGWTDE